jgi:steroid delta-isomerase-like uncharacterized protein
MSGTLDAGEVERVTQLYLEIFGQRQLERYGEILTEGYVNHTRMGPVIGIEAFKGFMEGIYEGLPDISWNILDTRADGDRIVYLYEVTATHRGEVMGIPATGRDIQFTGMEMNRIVDGKLAETWNYADLVSLMQQVGAIPSPG